MLRRKCHSVRRTHINCISSDNVVQGYNNAKQALHDFVNVKHYDAFFLQWRIAWVGLTENDGHENDGPSKLQGMKLQDIKMTDQK